MTPVFKNNFFGPVCQEQDVNYVHYALCNPLDTGNFKTLLNFEFDKKLCQSGYRKSFGLGLPNHSSLRFGLVLDHQQNVDALILKQKPCKLDNIRLRSCSKKPALKFNTIVFKDRLRGRKESTQSTRAAQKELYSLGLHQSFFSAYWLCFTLKKDFLSKKSPRAVLNNLSRDLNKIMMRHKEKCPILGLRVVASGRLGKRKKGMSQLIRRSIGKVPLSTLKAKIDYCQDVIPSSRGAIGLKVWICYA